MKKDTYVKLFNRKCSKSTFYSLSRHKMSHNDDGYSIMLADVFMLLAISTKHASIFSRYLKEVTKKNLYLPPQGM